MDALAVRGPEKPVGLGVDVGPIGSPGVADDEGRGPRADAELVVQAQEIRVVGADRPDFGLQQLPPTLMRGLSSLASAMPSF